MPLPLFLIVLPLASAALAWFLRPLTRLTALFATALTLFLAWATALWPSLGTVHILGLSLHLGQPWSLGNQSLVLDAATRPSLTFVFVIAAVCFLGSAVIPQSRSFAGAGLIVLSGFTAALLIHPLFISPVLLAITALVVPFFVQAEGSHATRGSVRQLLFPMLAFPLFLVAAWYLDQAPLTPGDRYPLWMAAQLLAWGFLLLLGAAPMHGAMRSLLGDSPPLAAMFLILGSNVVVLTLLTQFLMVYPGLAQQINAWAWLERLGLWSLLWGGVAAFSQRDFGRLVGYASLHDFGAVLLGLSLQGPLGTATVLGLMAGRAISLVLAALGLAILRSRMGGTDFSLTRGAITRLPWGVVGLLAGGLGLAAIPLTAGFAPRWVLLQLMAEQHPLLAVIPLLTAAGVAFGFVRGAAALAGSIHPQRLESEPIERESRLSAALVAILFLMAVGLALAPQIIAGPLDAALDALTAASF